MALKPPEIILNTDGSPKAFKASDVDSACRTVWNQVHDEGRTSLIVYVHGRAAGGLIVGNDREPNESFVKDKVINELETKHNAGVIMLHWPHRARALGFPRDAAATAGPLLVNMLKALAALKPAGPATVPVIVLTHSMGGIVLETAALTNPSAFEVAQSVITSASAAKLSGSVAWLASIPKAKVYVLRNKNDGTLKLVDSKGPFLGLGTAQELFDSGVAPSVFYLDVTDQNVKHPYFYVKDSTAAGRLRLRDKFFGPLYRGQKLNMIDFTLAVPGSSIYRLK